MDKHQDRARNGGPGRRNDGRPQPGGDRQRRGVRAGGEERGSERQRGGSRPGRAGERGAGRPSGTGRPGERARAARPPAPSVDEDVLPQMLDRGARARLRTLSKSNADHVARHLVMAGRLVDIEPELAYQHAREAVRSAGRVDIVREAMALTAYATERYAEALRELRTVRRLSGIDAHPAIEADCERGLQRPERALDVIAGARDLELPLEDRVELAIVESGARADLGEHEAGLVVVENMAARITEPRLLARLTSVRADRLAELGRGAQAQQLRATLAPPAADIVVTDLSEGEPVSATSAAPEPPGAPDPDPASDPQATAPDPDPAGEQERPNPPEAATEPEPAQLELFEIPSDSEGQP